MLTITTADLAGCIADALNFISPDKEDDQRRVVHLRWDADHDLFHASATDAIRVAISSWSPDDKPEQDVQHELGVELGSDGPSWEFVLTADDAAHLLKTIKPVKGLEYVPLFLDCDGALLGVTRSKEARVPGFALSYDSAGTPFPDLRTVVVEALGRAEPVKEIWWNQALAMDFGKVRQRGNAAKWTFAGSDKPAVVEIGERFVGALMPVRTGDEAH